MEALSLIKKNKTKYITPKLTKVCNDELKTLGKYDVIFNVDVFISSAFIISMPVYSLIFFPSDDIEWLY